MGNKNNITKRAGVGKSIFISYFSILFTLVSGLLYTPWLIKELGQSDYAIYSIVTSLTVYFTMDFGIGATITRFIAKCRSAGEHEKIKGILGLSLKIYLLIDGIALLALVILYFFIGGIYQGLTTDEISRLKIVYIIIGMMTIFCIPMMPLSGIYIAYGRVYNVKVFDLLTKLFIIVFVCVGLFSGLGLYFMVLVNAVVTVAMNYIKLVYITKTEHIKTDLKYKDISVVKEMLFFSAWLAIAMIADKFFFSIEPTLLGALSDSSQVAIFAVAAQIEGYVLILADGLNGIFLPRVTDMVVKKENTEKITDLMIKVGKLQLMIVTALIIGILTHGKRFINIWFGDKYAASYYAVVIVLLPCFIHLTQGIASEMIYATNNVKYRAFSYCIGASVNVLFAFFLIPHFGAIGAAISIALGFTVGHEIIMNIVYCKKLHLNIKRFFTECHVKMIIPAIISLLGGFVLTKYLPWDGLIGLLISGAIWVCIYLISVYIFFINKSEKDNLKKMLQLRFKKN